MKVETNEVANNNKFETKVMNGVSGSGLVVVVCSPVMPTHEDWWI